MIWGAVVTIGWACHTTVEAKQRLDELHSFLVLMVFSKPVLRGFHASVEKGHAFQCLELFPELVFSQINNEASDVENKARYPSKRVLSLTSTSSQDM